MLSPRPTARGPRPIALACLLVASCTPRTLPRNDDSAPDVADGLLVGAEDRGALKPFADAAHIDLADITVETDASQFPRFGGAPCASVLAKQRRIVGFALKTSDYRPHLPPGEEIARFFSRRPAPTFPGFALLGRLPGLGHLAIHASGVSTLRDVGALRGLRRLSLEQNDIASLEGSEGLVSLEQLSLDGNSIARTAPLGALRRLQSLALTFNKIVRFEGLDRLAALRRLDASRNELTVVDGASLPKQLEHLDVSFNQITRVALAPLVALRTLNLDGNRLESTDGLAQLAALETLRLEGNRLRTTRGLEKLARLRELVLSNNRIERIEAVEELTSLRTLDLNGCPVRSLAGVRLPPQLETLSVSQLASIGGLEELLAAHPNLKLVDLQDVNLSPAQRQRIKSLMKKHKGVYLRHCLKGPDGRLIEC